MVNKWVILPEIDKNNQNRYIVMVSSKEDADNLVKKYPHICSAPFRILDVKYKWGLYLNNSTKEERKGIYRYFTGGDLNADNELKKEDEVKDVISELNNLFSTLTEDEQRHLKQEIPEKIDNIEQFTERRDINIGESETSVVPDFSEQQEITDVQEEQEKDIEITSESEKEIIKEDINKESDLKISQQEISDKTEEHEKAVEETPEVQKEVEEEFSAERIPNKISKEYSVEEPVEEESLEITLDKPLEIIKAAENEPPKEAVPENVAEESAAEANINQLENTEQTAETKAFDNIEEEVSADITQEPKEIISDKATEDEEAEQGQATSEVLESTGAEKTFAESEIQKEEEKTTEETPSFKIEIERFGEPTAVIPTITGTANGKIEVNVSNTGPLKILYLYPSGEISLLENFTNQLKNIVEKSMKEPILIEKLSAVEYSVTTPNNFNEIVKNAGSQGAELIIAIIPDGLNDIRFFINKECIAYNILSLFASQEQLDKKFLYVDLAIELLLVKKKLRV
ncbi:MAG: hypothetical protein A2474_01420 [Elusimicrobia bacterium RIFOXYC2_FULL_34_12]|nr:MAG: hypothetical protein A2474_01420 [Elusimicrobia bacterium RIFOXYC2_FULL_34_12]